MTRHKCYHWRQKRQREAIRKSGIANLESDDRLAVEPVSLDEMERDQLVREAIFTLPERCRELIQLLFYAIFVVQYQDLILRKEGTDLELRLQQAPATG